MISRKSKYLSLLISVYVYSHVIFDYIINEKNLVQSLSIPDPYNQHKCEKEIPSALLIEERGQVIPGNGSNQFWTKFIECCKGYKPYVYDLNTCVPDCGDKCRNGYCVAPNICECFQGYVKNDDEECVSSCPLGCLNGYCHYDGSCICYPGYQLDATTEKFCRPICDRQSHGCRGANKNCTEPGICTCLRGYVKYSPESDDCAPRCELSCLHGYCAAPNQCQCYAKYRLKDGICQSECSQVCGNGRCIKPNICSCQRGYVYDISTTTCLPYCNRCINGVCIAPEKCKCFRGYKEMYPGSKACLPICSKPCIGGDCIAPEQCSCKGGGEPDALGHCRGPNEERCIEAIRGLCINWAAPSYNYLQQQKQQRQQQHP